MNKKTLENILNNFSKMAVYTSLCLCLHLRNYNNSHMDTYHIVIAMAILLEECQQCSKLIGS